MQSLLELRPFQSADGATCHRLRRDAFLGVFRTVIPDEAARLGAESYGEAEFTKQIAALDTMVAAANGDVIGFCTIRRPSPTHAEILYLYIDTRHRGIGIGSHLARTAERHILDAHPDLTRIYLDTAVPDYNQSFWEKLGFRAVESSTCEYPGGSLPAVRLAKPFS